MFNQIQHQMNRIEMVPEDGFDQSVAQAQSLIMSYFSSFLEMPESVIQFFMRDAVLVWDGTQLQGIEEIREFLSQLKDDKVEFQISGYDAQNCPDHSSGNISMIVVIGTYARNSHVCDFHSTFYLRYNHQERKAVIQYQTFQSF